MGPDQSGNEMPGKYGAGFWQIGKGSRLEMEYTGYLFVTFTDGRHDGEQIYFAISRDGLHWRDLNGGEPVLFSRIGERGVRDPFLLRSKEGNHFYLIATDLKIENNKGWDAAQYEGSRSLIVWESDDLVTWSEERSVQVGVEGAGCVWAPEAIYDKKKDAYLVFWASMVKLDGDREPKQRIYASYTKDFRAFSTPEIYIERDNHVIDTTIIEDNGIYYRFSKDETTKLIRMDCGADLNGAFTEIKSETLDGLYGVEGPEAYYIAEQNAWCLIVDQFASQKGYLPLLCKDLSTGVFQIREPGSYDLGGIKKRHGSVVTLTEEEYRRLETI